MMNRLSKLSFRKLNMEQLYQWQHGRECSLFKHNYIKEGIKENNFIKCGSNNVTTVSDTSSRYSTGCIPNTFVQRYIQSSSGDTCWNCQKILKYDSNELFCGSCNSLQPINKKNDYFIIFGLKRCYSLDQSELKKKFRYLQTLLHPDKFSSKPKKEQELSEEFSSIVNKAYSTLFDPLERGLYLLSLNRISIEEGTTDVDKLFLMEIMERNEEIENELNPQKLNELYKENREQLDLLISKVAQAFGNSDLQLAKKLLTEMKYYNTIENKIKEIKQKHNIPG